MSLIAVNNLAKYYGSTKIFERATFDVNAGDRIGLVGRNGTGKTTLLRIITGELEADGDDSTLITKAAGCSLGWLRQQDELGGDIRLWASMRSVFAQLDELEQRMRNLEQEMAQPQVYRNQEKLAEINDRYTRALNEFETNGGYTCDSQIRAILFGLGFLESDFSLPLDSLSGGQRMRAALARVLLQNPDLLLLDEPTNHLDIAAVEWLEEYLRTYKGAVMAVSHDRYFLDRVVSRIFEIESQTLSIYRGNYSAFVHQKKENLRRQGDIYRQTEEERKKLRRFIDKFQYGTKATMAKSKAKMLARLDPIEAPKAAAAGMKLQFKPRFKSANRVIILENLEKTYDRRLFGPLNLTVYRGERIALVGPNGTGKSTLLSILTGFVEPSAGEVRWGVGAEWSYYRQSLDDLEETNTVLEEILAAGERMTNEEARTILGRFLIIGEEVTKQVSTLSGGERSRVMLAKLFVQGANCLLLDEPTNHLDIAAKEALEEALQTFPGTLIFVSHDRYFIDQVAEKIWEMQDGHFRVVEGGWTGYTELLTKEKAALNQVQTVTVQQEKQEDKQNREEQRLRKQLERQIMEAEQTLEALEKEKTGLEWTMAEPDFVKRKERQDLLRRYAALSPLIEAAYTEWEKRCNALQTCLKEK
ncbi:MAG: ABC-F family ATP-binding cassette domain-containing protein [Negativicutes bacterium]|nr:ABC-F family ATP-binding cassette domain-containing protein [Negativicutes bacterium]